MPTLSVRVSDDLAARFDAAAASEGGRSAYLRRLTMGAVGSSQSEAPERGARCARVMVRLAEYEARELRRQAALMGLRPATWLAALARRRLLGRPTFTPRDAGELIGIRSEIRRIGVNINQIARALNTAVLEGRVLEVELAEIEALRRELRAHLQGLGEAFEGNLAHWAVDL